LHDHAPCHVHPYLEKKLSVLFPGMHFVRIPKNATGFVQAMDVGVNRSFRQHIRSLCTSFFAERPIDSPKLTAIEWRNQLLAWVGTAWDRVSSDTIRRVFRSIGVSIKPNGEEDDQVNVVVNGKSVVPLRSGSSLTSKSPTTFCPTCPPGLATKSIRRAEPVEEKPDEKDTATTEMKEEKKEDPVVSAGVVSSSDYEQWMEDVPSATDDGEWTVGTPPGSPTSDDPIDLTLGPRRSRRKVPVNYTEPSLYDDSSDEDIPSDDEVQSDLTFDDFKTGESVLGWWEGQWYPAKVISKQRSSQTLTLCFDGTPHRHRRHGGLCTTIHEANGYNPRCVSYP